MRAGTFSDTLAFPMTTSLLTLQHAYTSTDTQLPHELPFEPRLYASLKPVPVNSETAPVSSFKQEPRLQDLMAIQWPMEESIADTQARLITRKSVAHRTPAAIRQIRMSVVRDTSELTAVARKIYVPLYLMECEIGRGTRATAVVDGIHGYAYAPMISRHVLSYGRLFGVPSAVGLSAAAGIYAMSDPETATNVLMMSPETAKVMYGSLALTLAAVGGSFAFHRVWSNRVDKFVRERQGHLAVASKVPSNPQAPIPVLRWSDEVQWPMHSLLNSFTVLNQAMDVDPLLGKMKVFPKNAPPLIDSEVMTACGLVQPSNVDQEHQ